MYTQLTRRRMTRLQQCCLSLLCCGAMTIPAATATAAPVVLDTVLVTADRATEVALARPETITVVTKEDIRNKKMQNLRDVLENVPGVSFGVDAMNRTKFSIRGTESRHSLIMVDGMRQAGEYAKLMGAANEMERFSTNDIERVEITRGVAGGRYGADAIGGVVNIITKRPTKTAVSADYEWRQVQHDSNSEYTYNLRMDLYSPKVQTKLYWTESKTAPFFNHAYWEYRNLAMPEGRYAEKEQKDIFDREYIVDKNQTIQAPIVDNHYGDRSMRGVKVYYQPTNRVEFTYGYDRMNDETKTANFIGRVNLRYFLESLWETPELVTDKNKDFFFTQYLEGQNHIQRDTHTATLAYTGDHSDVRLRFADSTFDKYYEIFNRTVMVNTITWDYVKSNDRNYELFYHVRPSRAHDVTLSLQYKDSYALGTRINTPHRVQDFTFEKWTSETLTDYFSKNDHFTESSPMYRADLTERNAALSDEWRVNDKLTIIPTVRYTNHTTGTRWTGNLGAKYAKDDTTRIKMNLGTGFATPGILEMYHQFLMMPLAIIFEPDIKTDFYEGTPPNAVYYYPGWYWEGNPHLKPEKAFGADLSLEKDYADGAAKFTVFWNDIRDYMNFYYTNRRLPKDHPANLQGTDEAIYRIYSYENLERVKISGAELEYRHTLSDAWDVTASATYLHAVNDKTGKRLTMKPKWKYLLSVNYHDHGWRGAFWGEYSTDYIDIFDRKHVKMIAPEEGIAKNYGIWNILLEREFGEGTSLYAGVNNLFHYEAPSLGIRGRVYRVGARLRF